MVSPSGKCSSSWRNAIGIEMFDVDLPLEIHGIVQLHEFVSIAGITILAAEFAAPIGIDRPAKWQPGIVAFCHIFACRELEIFDAAL